MRHTGLHQRPESLAGAIRTDTGSCSCGWFLTVTQEGLTGYQLMLCGQGAACYSLEAIVMDTHTHTHNSYRLVGNL